MRRPVLGAMVVAVGAVLAVFGAIHDTTLLPAAQSFSGKGSTSVTYRVDITYYLYPIWSPPNWDRVD